VVCDLFSGQLVSNFGTVSVYTIPKANALITTTTSFIAPTPSVSDAKHFPS